MNQLTNQRRSTGFTLIELLLSMTFVSVLLLTIALTVVQMANTYNKGMTLKEVNQSARDISDDMRRAFAFSPVFAVPSTEDVGTTFAADTNDYIRLSTGTGASKAITGGRLCTGTVSYIWNIGAALHDDPDDKTPRVTSALAYVLGSTGTPLEPIQFVKVPDIDKKYCAKTTTGALLNKNITYDDTRVMTNLLNAGDHRLALQSFSVVSRATDALTGQQLYVVTYTIGSGSPLAMDLKARPMKCLDPTAPTANLTYCNVQQFTIVLRAGSTVN